MKHAHEKCLMTMRWHTGLYPHLIQSNKTQIDHYINLSISKLTVACFRAFSNSVSECLHVKFKVLSTHVMFAIKSFIPRNEIIYLEIGYVSNISWQDLQFKSFLSTNEIIWCHLMLTFYNLQTLEVMSLLEEISNKLIINSILFYMCTDNLILYIFHYPLNNLNSKKIIAIEAENRGKLWYIDIWLHNPNYAWMNTRQQHLKVHS